MLNNFNEHAFRDTYMSKLTGFDQKLPAECSIFPLLFGAEHYQSLEIALINVG
jgi:hypothetical protein